MKIALFGGIRTPFVKAGGPFKSKTFLDMGSHVVTEFVTQSKIDPTLIDELFFSTVLLDPRLPNFSREIVLRTGLPKSLVAHSVSNNCISGLLAVACAADGITAGRFRAALAGGSESMSTPTLTYPSKGEKWFLKLARARSTSEKLSLLAKFRPGFVVPTPPSPKEPSTGLTMGQHCELMAQEFKISRADQDAIALQSHRRAYQAQQDGIFDSHITGFEGETKDGLIRAETSIEKLSSLPAVFDKSTKGTISAGNSSALTDGASVVGLCGDDQLSLLGVKPIGFIDGVHFAAVPPGDGLLMAPGIAVPILLKKHGLTFADIDIFEIHEAFSAQVIANKIAWSNGWDRYPELGVMGEIPNDKFNIYGGSIALGHPFAATGGRLLLSACEALKRTHGKRALISVCAAGGAAGAVLVSAP